MTSHPLLKRVILLSVSIVVILLIYCLFGCEAQNAYSDGFCISKSMINSYKKDDFPGLFTIPKHIMVNTSEYSVPSVSIDANVITPETASYPIVIVKKKEFSCADLQSMIDICMGCRTNLYSDYSLNKSEWLKKIEALNELRSAELIREDWRAFIQSNFEAAPDVAINQKINIQDYYKNADQILYAQNQSGDLSQFYFSKSTNLFIYYRDIYMTVNTISEFTEDQFDEEYESLARFTWRTPDKPNISEKKAFDIAQNYMSSLNSQLSLFEAEPCSVIVDDCMKTVGWMFTFTRNISGMQFPFLNGWIYANPYEPPRFVSMWGPEILRIAVDQAGLCMIWWGGASELKNTVANSIALEPFELIIERIPEQFIKLYKTHINAVGAGLHFDVTKITLCTSLLAYSNKQNQAVYIPTWCIDYQRRWENSDELLDVGQIFLSAIDGSYIEPRMLTSEATRLVQHLD